MANLYFGNKITDVEISDGIFGSRHYRPYFPERWEEAKAILSKYGITLSNFEVIFEGDEYKIQGVPGHFGSRSGRVFYKDTVVAKGWITGANYCDREANLEIYLDKLKSVYKKD